jgi:phosphohistidine phosphatase
MRRLMLLRHAKSDWSSPGMPDRERPLNARGATDARTMSVYLAHHALIPDRILCSPAQRTRQTAEAIVQGWPKAAEIAYSDRLYEATPETIISLIRAVAAEVQGLLVIGHNPGLHEAARMLIAAGDIEPRERLHEKFPDRRPGGDRFRGRYLEQAASPIRPARPFRHPALDCRGSELRRGAHNR